MECMHLRRWSVFLSASQPLHQRLNAAAHTLLLNDRNNFMQVRPSGVSKQYEKLANKKLLSAQMKVAEVQVGAQKGHHGKEK